VPSAWHMLGHMPDDATGAQRRVRLFRNGRNQAVRIPREFELPGDEAIMRREGDRLVLEPAQPTSLLAVLASLEPLDEELPAVEDLPPEELDL
jgi:antitoxin VapB